jgi:dTDP-glucose pyrophosphorylase
MRVVVPMAGQGDRFIRAGYADPKPLIRLADGKRIIEHVVGMFADDDFVFVCNYPHLRDTPMRSVIESLCPSAKIVGMPVHKRGPVWTVKAAYDEIPDDEPVIVAYCDGAVRWDYGAFLKHVAPLDGCLVTHSGFHPHTLSSTRMAYLRTEEQRVLEVKEKASFTDEPITEHASSGVYYFRSGGQLKRYFDKALEGPSFNGEHYVTLVYNLMIQDGLNVGYFDTSHVAILGTPSEVQNYEAWQTILRGEQVKDAADALACYEYWSSFNA